MPKPPQIKAKELELVLLHLGFVKRSARGSHAVYKHQDGRKTVIAFHNRNLPTNTLRAILKQCHLSVADLVKLLR